MTIEVKILENGGLSILNSSLESIRLEWGGFTHQIGPHCSREGNPQSFSHRMLRVLPVSEILEALSAERGR